MSRLLTSMFDVFEIMQEKTHIKLVPYFQRSKHHEPNDVTTSFRRQFVNYMYMSDILSNTPSCKRFSHFSNTNNSAFVIILHDFKMPFTMI